MDPKIGGAIPAVPTFITVVTDEAGQGNNRILDLDENTGFEKTRWKVVEGNDLFNIHVTTEPEQYWFKDRRYVKLGTTDQAGKDVYVNINSVMTRTLLSEDQIRKASKEGELVDLIKDTAKRVQEATTMIEEAMGQQASSKHLISELTMLKVARAFIGMHGVEQSIHKVENNPQEASKFLMVRTNSGMKMFNYSAREYLDEGSAAAAFRIQDLGTGIFEVLKKVHLDPDADAIKQASEEGRKKNVVEEAAVLSHINPGGRLKRVQKAPHILIDVRDGHEHIVGHLCIEYDRGSLKTTFDKSSHLQKLKDGRQTLEAFEECFKRDVRHRDVKMRNFLADRSRGVVLGDWEAPMIADKGVIKLVGSSNSSPYTPDHMTYPEYEQGQRRLTPEQAFQGVMLAHGTVLFKLVADDYTVFPHEIDVRKKITNKAGVSIKNPRYGFPYPDSEFNDGPLKEANCPPTLIEKIRLMTELNPNDRAVPSAAFFKEMYAEMDAFIASRQKVEDFVATQNKKSRKS